ncbi:ATP-binding protein [Bacteroides sp.]|uniref:hybrid sensor histidine kinase/response regulator transcription factor n=1 Tax=Bacteroides sp. TaxID=29523 RepID=UPI003D0C6860
MKKILSILILNILPVCYCLSQSIITKQMPFFYDLVSNEIWDIYQDRIGYLWIGTTNGLARYDGFNLQNFRNDYRNPNLLSDNNISDFAENNHYLFIATRKGLSLFNKNTLKMQTALDSRLRSINIESILSTKDNELWIAGESQIIRCDSLGNIKKIYQLDKILNKKKFFSINSIYEDSYGNLWGLLGRNGGLCKYDVVSDTFVQFEGIAQIDYFVMYQDRKGRYWIGTWGNGLWEFDPNAKVEKRFKEHPIFNKKTKNKESLIYSIVEDDIYGYIWALSYNELYALSPNSNGELIPIDLKDKVDTHKMYTRIVKDREGNLWLGSYDEAKIICTDQSPIKNYSLSQIKKDFGWDVNLVNLFVDDNKVIWMSQDRLGLCCYNLASGKVSYPKLGGKMMEVNHITKSHTPGMMWINDRSIPHLMKVSYQNENISIKYEIYLNQINPNCGGILQIEEDQKENLWVLTEYYLFVITPEGINCKKRSMLNTTSIISDKNGNIWGFSQKNELQRFEVLKHIKCKTFPATLSLKPTEHVQFSCFDFNGNLWVISSLGNVYHLNITRNEFQPIHFNGRLDNSTILNLQADHAYLWIVTNKKIIKYHPNKHSFNEYSAENNNIEVNIFRNQAVYLDGNGGIFAGGHNGFVHILPNDNLMQSSTTAIPIITDILVNNQSIYFDLASDKKNTVNNIYLQPDARNIEINLSTLEYGLGSTIQISYKLEGMDKDWNNLPPNRHTAFYNQLPKGIYKFKLRYMNKLNQWIECENHLNIIQQPFFYETWYAYIIYTILILGVFYSILHYYTQRIREKNDMKLKDDLSRMKLDYFTNISHELLTPLSVITAMVELWQQNNSSTKKQIEILLSNVAKLRRLIQQVLDFRKIDIKKMPLAISYGRIDSEIKKMCYNSFRPLAEKKNISLEIKIAENEIEGYLDFDKLDLILYNILSNAIKYTPNNKRVEVRIVTMNKMEHRYLKISVEDEGIGIQAKELEQIFTRFYTNINNVKLQSNGIGLYLVKELAELHHGSIQVCSEYGKGSTFEVVLPIDKESYDLGEIALMPLEYTQDKNSDNAPISNDTDSTNKYQVLIIDDDLDLLYVMQQALQTQYIISTATNTKQAWQYIVEENIDIIVCDVMLPDDNGWNLCRKVKTDMRFRHIPIIVLTAKQTTEDRIISYNVGADGFIAKPFDIDVLQAKINNLVAAYIQRQQIFRKESDINLETLPYKTEDKDFLQHIVSEIEAHLSESEFDLDKLAANVNMSKSTLYRKIKGMTGLTPLDFILNIKMKHACHMLSEHKLTISEIAYTLGYTNPKYFTKCFKEELGLTPTEFQQGIK